MMRQTFARLQDRMHRAHLAIAARRDDGPGAALSYCNAIDLPRIALDDAIRGHREGTYLQSEDWRVFKRLAPEFVDSASEDPRFTFSDAAIAYPPAFLASVPNATLTGFRSIVTRSGHVVNDDCVPPNQIEDFARKLGQRLNAGEYFSENAGFVGAVDGTLRLQDANRPARRVHGSAILLSSDEPLNYGSLLFRVLPKIHALRRWNLEDRPYLVPVLGTATATLLEMAGLRADRMIPHDCAFRYKIDHLLVPSLRNNQAFLDPESLDFYTALRERFGQRQQAGKRIYVSRQQFNRTGKTSRFLTNERELEARLEAIGFEIFHPEQHTLRRQIETFSSAEMIVGPSGSAMFNVVFCWPGTKVIDIESEPWWLHAHMCLFSSCKLRYGMIIGNVDPNDERWVHKSWSLDVERTCARVTEFGDKS